jgi:hypothetical protein
MQTTLATIRNLPAILTGRDKNDPHNLRGTFIAAFTYRLIEQMYAAFEIKSLGGSDDLGHTFAPLSSKRLKQKSSPWFRRKYPYAITNAIMRVTDKLFESYRPGQLGIASYFPPKNQVVELRNNLIKITSKVEYAQYQNAKRPFFPDDISPWISSAINAGLEALALKLERLT